MTPSHKLKLLLEGDIVWDTVKQLIHDGADPKTKSKHSGATVLHRASVEAPPSMLPWIVQRTSCAAQIRCAQGLTPLMWAAASGNIDAVVLLVPFGGILSQQVLPPHSTALHLAASGGHLHCVQALIHNGAIITTTDEFGRTPLVCAVLNGHSTVTKALAAILASEREVLYQEWLGEYILTLRDRIIKGFLSKTGCVDLGPLAPPQTTNQDDVAKWKNSLPTQ